MAHNIRPRNVKPRYYKNCSDCVFRVYSFGANGCSHKLGGHSIKDIHKEHCVHFKCEWCGHSYCICKRSDFY